MDRSGEGKYFSTFSYSLCPSTSGKKNLFFREWTAHCSTFTSIHICLKIFQNHHKRTETWTNIVKIILLINLLTDLTQKSTFMNYYDAATLWSQVCNSGEVWCEVCQSFICRASAKKAAGGEPRHPAPRGADRAAFPGCWRSRARPIPILPEAKRPRKTLPFNVIQLLHHLRSVTSKYI